MGGGRDDGGTHTSIPIRHMDQYCVYVCPSKRVCLLVYACELARGEEERARARQRGGEGEGRGGESGREGEEGGGGERKREAL
jgi:hypothetical protein